MRILGIRMVVLVAVLWGSAGLEAQVCNPVNGQPDIGYVALPGSVPGAINCGGLACYTPQLSDVRYEARPIGCDPSSETCSIRAFVPAEIRGNSNNGSAFVGNLVLEWTSPQGQAAGSCGAGVNLLDEKAEGWIQVGGFTCNGSFDAGTYSFRARVCGCPPGFPCPCERTRSVNVDLNGPTIAAAVCPSPPKPWGCNESGSCQAGCMGPNGSGAGGRGSGGASAAGGGPGLGGTLFGQGAFLRYQAGGIGATGNPLPADWTTLLGRYWSHDYAERIVPDPDDSHVWLLTKNATFREFIDAGLDGIYETAVPSDEYRQLTKTAGGWELRELDGMVHAYDLQGRWVSTTDRNGNAKTATYDAMNRLDHVDFPDGRHELFAYDAGGRLAMITEVGVDGTSTRVWAYTWTGDDLTGIDRPDGRSWELRYDDPAHPGFLTRLTLIGDDDTSERIEGAWQYDGNGNVVATWRGATDKTDATAVDLWQFAFDDPALPVTTTVTDPLGTVSLHTFGRDDGSLKPRLEGVTGDCPTSCAGANSSTAFTDAAHPLRPTSSTNGRGYGPFMRTWWPFGSMTLQTSIPYPDDYPHAPETLGEHIKKARMDRDLYQQEVADIIGVDTRSIQSWETGNTQPRAEGWPNVIQFLGYDPYGEPESFSEKMCAVMRRNGFSKGMLASVLNTDPTTIGTWIKRDGPGWPRLRREMEMELDALLENSPRQVLTR